MAKLLLALGVLVVPGLALAADMKDDEWWSAVLHCFHPTADYVSTTMHPDTVSFSGKSASAELGGTIHFLGGFTKDPYYMDFTVYMRRVDGESEIKVAPGKDTAPFPPNPNCMLRGWN